MPDNEIRLNCKVSEAMDPLIYSDLSIRTARTRTRRLVQLAYLGLLYEKQSLGTGDTLQTTKNTTPVASSAAAKTADAIPSISTQGLAPPDGFGEDMNDLFEEGGISLNT